MLADTYYVCIYLIVKSYHKFSSFWAAVSSLSSAAAWSKAEHVVVLSTQELHDERACYDMFLL